MIVIIITLIVLVISKFSWNLVGVESPAPAFSCPPCLPLRVQKTVLFSVYPYDGSLK